MARYRYGQIAMAWVYDGSRYTKLRPVLIIDEDYDYRVSGQILVIAISSSPSKPCPYYHIKVHESTKKDPETGLSMPSWAKCNFAGT
jgi:hypothetical protein